MRNMWGRSWFKFFHPSAAPSSSTTQPSSSAEYQHLKDEKDSDKHSGSGSQRTSTAAGGTAPIPIIRRESSSSDYAPCNGSYDHDYMLVDVYQRLCKSVDIEKRLSCGNMDQLDRIPMDFSGPTGPTIMTDPEEVGEILLCGESRAVYEDQPTIYGLAPCSIYRAERWFHQDADHKKAERMLLRTGGKDGSFLIRVNRLNCLVLTVCHHEKIYNIFINCKVEGHKTRLFIERSRQFSNLIDLIKYYTKHQGLFLPCKLTRGVALRWPGSTKFGVSNRLCVEED